MSALKCLHCDAAGPTNVVATYSLPIASSSDLKTILGQCRLTVMGMEFLRQRKV